MARLEGTGKDPLGRYGKGEVFDVPKYLTTPDAAIAAVGNGDDLAVNPAYQEILDKGWAKELDPVDDPARTKTQIADDIVSRGGDRHFADPVDAAIAATIPVNDAYAIQHTGDPEATADGDLNGNLKPDGTVEAQVEANPAPELQETPASEQDEKTGSTSGSKSSSGSSSSSSSKS